MNFKEQPIGSFLLVSIVLGLLIACAPVHSENSKKAFYEPREHYISGHLYRNGRHIHHHPERHRPKQEKDISEQK